VVGDLDSRSIGLTFLWAWTQWFGGLGIIVLFLAIVIEPGTATRQLGMSQDLRRDLIGGMRAHARLAIGICLGLTALAVGTLWACGSSFQNAVLLALTSVSTGGFTPATDSLADVGTAVVVSVFGFCVLGALPFHVYYRSITLDWRIACRDLQVRGLLAALLVSVSLVMLLNHWNPDEGLSGRLAKAAALGVSAQTGAGFFINSPSELSDSGKLSLIAPMLLGGGLGSTTGGIKILRLLLIVRLFQLMLIRFSVPASARISARLAGRPRDTAELQGSIAIVLALLMTTGFSTLAVVSHGYDPVGALFDVVSAVGTVGLSTGIVSAELPALLKAVLCLDMLLGRLETVAIVALLFSWTWIGRRRASSLEWYFPEQVP